MKIVKFEAVQDEFVRLTPRTMTIEGVMQKIADGLIAAVQNEGKGKGRTGKVFSFNAEKGIRWHNEAAFYVSDHLSSQSGHLC